MKTNKQELDLPNINMEQFAEPDKQTLLQSELSAHAPRILLGAEQLCRYLAQARASDEVKGE